MHAQPVCAPTHLLREASAARPMLRPCIAPPPIIVDKILTDA